MIGEPSKGRRVTTTDLCERSLVGNLEAKDAVPCLVRATL